MKQGSEVRGQGSGVSTKTLLIADPRHLNPDPLFPTPDPCLQGDFSAFAGSLWESFYKEQGRDLVPRYPAEAVVRFAMRHFGQGRPAPEAFRTPLGAGSKLGGGGGANRGRHRRPRILDLGCGGGRHARFLKAEGFSVFGMDYTEGSLRMAGAMGRIPLARASYRHLPFASGILDGVVAYAVFCYGTPDEIAEGVEEVCRVLRPGGQALLWFRATDDHRYGNGREVGENCFVLDLETTNERGMPVSFFDRSGIDGLTRKFSHRFIGFSKNCLASGRTDSDWLVEVEK